MRASQEEEDVVPLARNHWTFGGKVDASIGGYGLHHVHTYLGKVDQPPDVENTVSIHSAVRAMQEECFSGIATMASLALALSWAAGQSLISNVAKA